jgi:hypothetical protein
MMSACSSNIRANESSAARIRALPARFRALAEKQRRLLSPRFCHLTKTGCFFTAFYPQPVDNFCGLCVIFLQNLRVFHAVFPIGVFRVENRTFRVSGRTTGCKAAMINAGNF